MITMNGLEITPTMMNAFGLITLASSKFVNTTSTSIQSRSLLQWMNSLKIAKINLNLIVKKSARLGTRSICCLQLESTSLTMKKTLKRLS